MCSKEVLETPPWACQMHLNVYSNNPSALMRTSNPSTCSDAGEMSHDNIKFIFAKYSNIKKRAIQELRSHYFIDIVIFEWLPPSTVGAIFCYVTKSIILHLVTNTVITENNPTMWKNNPIFGCQEQTY